MTPKSLRFLRSTAYCSGSFPKSLNHNRQVGLLLLLPCSHKRILPEAYIHHEEGPLTQSEKQGNEGLQWEVTGVVNFLEARYRLLVGFKGV